MTEQFTNVSPSNPIFLGDPITSTSQASVTFSGGYAALPTSGTQRLQIGNEIVVLTSRTGAVGTITRGTESTTASEYNAGTAVVPMMTAEAIAQLKLDIGGAGGAGLPWTVVDVTASPYNADPTGVTDCSAAILSAMTACSSGGGGSGYGWLYFPLKSGGTYKVNTGVISPAGLTQLTMFMDPAASIVSTTPSGSTPLFDLGQTNSLNEIDLYNFSIEGPDSSIVSGSVGIAFGATSVHMNGCSNSGIYQFDTGIDIANALSMIVSGSFLGSNNTGMSATNVPMGIVSECFFDNTNDVAVLLTGCSGVTVENNSISPSGIGIKSVGSTYCTVGSNTWVIGGGITGVQLDSASYGWRTAPFATNGGTAIADANGCNEPPQFSPGSPITAATTTTLTGVLNYITGATTIETLNAPADVMDQTTPFRVALVFLDALTLGVVSSGNMAAVSAIAANQLVVVEYDWIEEVWYATAPSSGNGYPGYVNGSTFDVGFGLNIGGNGIGNNAVFGYGCMQASTTGAESNTVCGVSVFNALTSGTSNTGIGYGVGDLLTTGNGNTFVGYTSGSGFGNPTTGSYNTLIGALTTTSTNMSHAIAIGSGAQATAAATTAGVFFPASLGVVSGTSVQYNSSTGALGPTSSTKRHKKHIRPLEFDSAICLKLQAKSFSRRHIGGIRILGKEKPGNRREFGYIAEDVAKLVPRAAPRDRRGRPESVSYDILSVLTNEELKKAVQALKAATKRIDRLEREVAKMKGKRPCRK